MRRDATRANWRRVILIPKNSKFANKENNNNSQNTRNHQQPTTTTKKQSTTNTTPNICLNKN